MSYKTKYNSTIWSDFNIIIYISLGLSWGLGLDFNLLYYIYICRLGPGYTCVVLGTSYVRLTLFAYRAHYYYIYIIK